MQCPAVATSAEWLRAQHRCRCEFTFVLLVRRQDLAQTLQAYRFEDGNILPLVLLAVVIAPTVAAYIRAVLTPNNRWGKR
jgi:hypothetical protein